MVLGVTGDNFGAGMTGGMAFVYDGAAREGDADGGFARRINPDSIVLSRVASAHWDGVLRGLVEEHVAETDSKWGADLLLDWARCRGDFWQVCPKEMLGRLAHPLSDAPLDDAVPVLVAAE